MPSQSALYSAASLGRSLPNVRKHTEKERPLFLSERSSRRNEGRKRCMPSLRPVASSTAGSAAASTSGASLRPSTSVAIRGCIGAPGCPASVNVWIIERRCALAALTAATSAPSAMGVHTTAYCRYVLSPSSGASSDGSVDTSSNVGAAPSVPATTRPQQVFESSVLSSGSMPALMAESSMSTVWLTSKLSTRCGASAGASAALSSSLNSSGWIWPSPLRSTSRMSALIASTVSSGCSSPLTAASSSSASSAPEPSVSSALNSVIKPASAPLPCEAAWAAGAAATVLPAAVAAACRAGNTDSSSFLAASGSPSRACRVSSDRISVDAPAPIGGAVQTNRRSPCISQPPHRYGASPISIPLPFPFSLAFQIHSECPSR